MRADGWAWWIGSAIRPLSQDLADGAVQVEDAEPKAVGLVEGPRRHRREGLAAAAQTRAHAHAHTGTQCAASRL